MIWFTIALVGVVVAPLQLKAQHVAEPVPQKTALGSGPHKAIMEADPGLPGMTVYRPQDLAAIGAQKLRSSPGGRVAAPTKETGSGGSSARSRPTAISSWPSAPSGRRNRRSGIPCRPGPVRSRHARSLDHTSTRHSPRAVDQRNRLGNRRERPQKRAVLRQDRDHQNCGDGDVLRWRSGARGRGRIRAS